MSTPARVAEQFVSSEQQRDAAQLGMWIFLATELLFFGPLFFGYVYGRTHYPEAFAAASQHTKVWLGTANTALLLTSSFAMALAVAAARADRRRFARWALYATAALGVAFLLIKGSEYAMEWHERLVPALRWDFAPAGLADGAQLFFLLYFAMTLVHALHLTIGIVLASLFGVTIGHATSRVGTAEHVEVAGLYWHFVDVVWIVLYPLLYLAGRAAA